MLLKGKEKSLPAATSRVRIRVGNDPGGKPLYIQRHILPSREDDEKRRKTEQNHRCRPFFAVLRRVSSSCTDLRRVPPSFTPFFVEFRRVAPFYAEFGGADRSAIHVQEFFSFLFETAPVTALVRKIRTLTDWRCRRLQAKLAIHGIRRLYTDFVNTET